jgi:hypothetical protein
MNETLETDVRLGYGRILYAIKEMQNSDFSTMSVDTRGYDQRKIAIAKTNLETGMYWLEDAMRGYRQPTDSTVTQKTQE